MILRNGRFLSLTRRTLSLRGTLSSTLPFCRSQSHSMHPFLAPKTAEDSVCQQQQQQRFFSRSVSSQKKSYYKDLEESINSPETFWKRQSKNVHWFRKGSSILDLSSAPHGTWFSDFTTNICYNALDRHVESGHGEQTALIFDSPITQTPPQHISYADLLAQVQKFAVGLRRRGIRKGDRVVLYMPMIPETLITMLACARIGAIHTVVFGGFGSVELARRIDDTSPKMIVIGSPGFEPGKVVDFYSLASEALRISKSPPPLVCLLQRNNLHPPFDPPKNILDWNDLLISGTEKESRCEEMFSNDPLYILHTSGTTNRPKGIIRDHGGYMTVLKYSMKYIYGFNEGETFFTLSDVGWVVGHSYILYAPLLHRCTSILFEGKPVQTPDAGVIWRLIHEHKVDQMFTAPTVFRAIRKEDPEGIERQKYDISSLRTLWLAGERSDDNTIQWLEKSLQIPVYDHYWQTESGWPILGYFTGYKEKFPVKYGSVCKPVVGYNLEILDEEGEKQVQGKAGSLCAKLPLPPGFFRGLWGARGEALMENYFSSFPNYYRSGDIAFVDEDGYMFLESREDDVINVAGHRLMTSAMESAVSNHENVADVAVIGVPDELKGQIPLCFVIPLDHTSVDQLEQECIELVRNQIGPVAAFKLVIPVSKLPKTRSGKILRGPMVKLAGGENILQPPTLENPEALEEIRTQLLEKGFSVGEIMENKEWLANKRKMKKKF